MERAIFAGGCFWCMQPVFDKQLGVLTTTVGYCGGTAETADYKTVCSGTTDHAEVIAIDFDPSQTSFLKLLQVFWRNIDPTTLNQQFVDKGRQYRTAIFCTTQQQFADALSSRSEMEKSGKYSQPIVTEIQMAPEFYAAEEYHQKFYLKQTDHYKGYRKESGRDEYISCTWGG